jgi:hypothetical protein
MQNAVMRGVEGKRVGFAMPEVAIKGFLSEVSAPIRRENAGVKQILVSLSRNNKEVRLEMWRCGLKICPQASLAAEKVCVFRTIEL